ncbi:iron-containing alcohol dehydrogenase family protein [Desulfovibrio sp. OttesenSCG-928-F20]|nr:iron-containing alcohol dehydrogenase family protein [Desulfovibrio sp. OttesenSCG-928-F20]
MTRNTKNVPYYQLGFGAFAGLGELINARRPHGGPALFFVDQYFQTRPLVKDLPAQEGDKVIFVDCASEPTVEYVDSLADGVKAMLAGGLPCCMVGIGGGATMDVTKAVANLLTNPGKAEDYQGWDLVKNAPPYTIGVPTLAGTGSECSRTCVLTNARRKLKLGMNSDFTVFDQLVLDPDLTRSAPREQFFFTGMDIYMHCLESLNGSYRNTIVDRLSQTALDICRDVFLGDGDMMAEANLENMMVASYFSGMAAGNTGLVHPLSAGLSIVLHLPHGRANCHALSVLGEFYPKEQAEFTAMLERNKIDLPRGICRNLTDDQYEALYQGSIVHEKPLSNALGPDFKSILTKDRLIGLFKAM